MNQVPDKELFSLLLSHHMLIVGLSNTQNSAIYFIVSLVVMYLLIINSANLKPCRVSFLF
jgi:hypothetical protein